MRWSIQGKCAYPTRFLPGRRRAVSLFHRSLAAALLFASVAVPGSQAATDAEGENIQRFSFQTLLLAAPEVRTDASGKRTVDLPQLFFLTDGEFRPLSLANQRLGLTQNFEGPPPFRLYERSTGAEGETVHRPVATLTPGPENLQPGHQILLLRPHDDAGYHLNALAADPDTLGTSEILVLNGSTRQLAARAGEDDPTLVAPGEATVVAYDTGEADKFRLELAANEGAADWRLIHNRRIIQRRNEPLFLIVHPNPRRPEHWNVRFLRLRRPHASPAE